MNERFWFEDLEVRKDMLDKLTESTRYNPEYKSMGYNKGTGNFLVAKNPMEECPNQKVLKIQIARIVWDGEGRAVDFIPHPALARNNQSQQMQVKYWFQSQENQSHLFSMLQHPSTPKNIMAVGLDFTNQQPQWKIYSNTQNVSSEEIAQMGIVLIERDQNGYPIQFNAHPQLMMAA